MKRARSAQIQRGLYGLMVVLTVSLLLYLWFTPNVHVWQGRGEEGFSTVENISYTERTDPDSPVGIVREFRFCLDQVAIDTSLIFRFSHQNAAVYLDGELIYTLENAEELSIVRTTGNNWAMIPLYREDAGREILVELTPIYQNYQSQKVEFVVGSKLDVYMAELAKSLSETLLSIVDTLIGVILLCITVYFLLKKEQSAGFFSLGMLAISLGLWNFTQTDFAVLLLREKTVFTYYVSLTMLMLCIIPLIKSVRTVDKEPFERGLGMWCIACGVMSVAQLLLQVFGLFDLRETLKITHGMLIVTAVVLIISSVAAWRGRTKGAPPANDVQGIWILGLGVLLDMLNYYYYYYGGGSGGLRFVLVAILCFVVIEGARIISDFVRQKQMLEEKETQLVLSRVTTMMSQIRSHFVFNILNAISGMCKYDPEKADETIVRFARYLRNNIGIMEDDSPVPFARELSRLEDYVVLEQVRFGDRIEFCTDIRADQFVIPPLILQPVVENAIKHGLTKKEAGGTVWLRTWEDSENIKISVEDDGVGFVPEELEKKDSVGIRNIRYRLKHLAHGTLEIESQVDVGTTVTITIPKKECKSCTLST